MFRLFIKAIRHKTEIQAQETEVYKLTQIDSFSILKDGGIFFINQAGNF